ncbi:MAG: right-handed parallel beta-helix repeat-containing protein, partial [Pyrinomonadaceae bacterium]|nr:right-handed parallel beta-helix repeat-containing protein [Pyrinomonadaceae bacterium]
MYFGAQNPAAYSVKASGAGVENLVNLVATGYINFDNLAFAGANAHAFYLDRAAYIQITNCDISFSGINGISLLNGTSYNITVRHCSITHTNNDAIYANNGTYWTIENNVIRNTGVVRGMGQSGDGQYNAIHYVSSNSVVQYNEIKNTGYIGIHFIGSNTVIKNNFIDSFCLVKSDGGGIYTYDYETGSNRKVIGNIVGHGLGDRNGVKGDPNDPTGGWVHGIFMDGNSGNVTIEGNTSFNNAYSGLWFGSSKNMQASNNLFYNNTTTQVKLVDTDSSLSNVNITGNMLVARDSIQLGISIETRGLYNFGTLDNNYYCRPLYEPQGISTGGYPNAPYSFANYPGGGFVQPPDHRFYSLDQWQALSGRDMNTKKSPATIDDLQKMRFEYNAAGTAKQVALDGTYVDVRGQSYSGSLTLAPYSAVVLLRSGSSTPALQNQSISFAAVANKTYGDAPFSLSATASSGLPVSFRVVSGPATVVGNVVTLTGTGTVVVEASQSGNASYNTAPPVTRSFNVNAATNAATAISVSTAASGCISPTFLNNGEIIADATCGNNNGSIW